MAADSTRDIFRQDLPGDRSLTGEDLQRLRFGVALRGYSMTQVDDVLDRLSGELADRDRRIADLEALLSDRGLPLPDRRQPVDSADSVDDGSASVPGPGAETLR